MITNLDDAVTISDIRGFIKLIREDKDVAFEAQAEVVNVLWSILPKSKTAEDRINIYYDREDLTKLVRELKKKAKSEDIAKAWDNIDKYINWE